MHHPHRRKIELLWQKDDAPCLVGPESVFYYELLIRGETFITKRYQQQLTDLNRFLLDKSPEYRRRQLKFIFFKTILHYISVRTKPVRDQLEALSWEVLPHGAYSPDLAPSVYHLFASMSHVLAEQRVSSSEDMKKWLDE